MKLIGITGRRRSGKDTVALALMQDGYQLVKFAGALKEMLRALLAYAGLHEDSIESAIEGSNKEFPIKVLNGKSARVAMQTLGTEWGRDLISQSLWVDICMARCRQFEKAVISDVRFPNELAAIKSAGGIVLRVTRPCGDLPSEPSSRDNHISEQVETLPVDFEIMNNGTIDELHYKVRQLV